MTATAQKRQQGHTPGPWEIDDEFQICANNRIVAQCDCTCGVSVNEIEPNACLIAAAPDLLAALKAVIGHGYCEASSVAAGYVSSNVSQIVRIQHTDKQRYLRFHLKICPSPCPSLCINYLSTVQGGLTLRDRSRIMRLFLLSLVLLAGCTSHGVTQDVITNPDGSKTVFNTMQRTNTLGIDQSATEIELCNADGCKTVATSFAADGGEGKLLGPAIAIAAGYAGGQALVRPDRTNIGGTSATNTQTGATMTNKQATGSNSSHNNTGTSCVIC
jgi:hypothetical protein